MKLLNILKNLIYGILTTILILLALGFISSNMNLLGGYKLFSVQSGSMEPAIKTGSIIISFPQIAYMQGEIIVFKQDEESVKPVTHRIHEVKVVDEIELLYTKGDANNVIDAQPITKDLIIGKVILSIPYLGYPFLFAQTEMGFILLIVIPATIIIVSEIMIVKDEVKKLLNKKNEKILE